MKLYFGNAVTTITTVMVLALLGFIGYSVWSRASILYWGRRTAFYLHLDWLSAALRQRGMGWIKRCSAPLMAAVRLAFSHLSAFPQSLAALGRS